MFFYGPMATLKVLDDNVLVKKALETLPAGTVLVVDGGGAPHAVRFSVII
ncbi:hypothetical protein GCM10020331_058240 [Ectobacillus funiculus]